MNLYSFIWSRESPDKYARHLVYWITTYVVFILTVMVSFLTMDRFTWQDLAPRFWSKFLILLICMAYTYMVVYRFLPTFILKRRMPAFILRLAAATLLAYVAMGLAIYLNTMVFKTATALAAGWIVTMNFLFMGPPVVCLLFLACKMLKTYFEKMEEKVSLARENANAELQLLKAQVHPHFLFNTLNNIYSFTITRSPEAPLLVKKLSGMLRYMTSECDQPLVPLYKELKILRDYIDLEKVRYGNRLSLRVNVRGDTRHKLIAPLLLIPFVENSFKHGSSKMLERPWIVMEIRIGADKLLFSISNSKPAERHRHIGENGIGLGNVQQRLKLLYPGEHHLEIIRKEHSYEVRLHLPLHLAGVPKMNGAGVTEF
ncbi:MAG TPA: histidine kinase [Sphingobacteriaceae bacterium]